MSTTATTPPATTPTTAQPGQTGAIPRLIDLLVVGAGFAGLYMLHKARQLGLSVQVIEAAPGVGGTWYHNRYPGARVDIQSMEYSYSFDEDLQQQWQWTERFSAQPELLKYANHVADRFKLRDGIKLNTRLTGADWDESAQRWQARASTGETWSARFMVMATGPLSTPNTPKFDGLESFAGAIHHTANWPHQPVDFSGQRVGIIGTGSSAVQAIPHIAEQASALTVFQRTPAYVVPSRNAPLDPAFATRIKADYAGFRQRNRAMYGGFGSELPPHRVSALAVSDEERRQRYEERWAIGGFTILGTFYDTMLDARANELCAQFVRGKIAQTVKDPATAALLSPSYAIGCKRLCVDSTGYYDTYNLPHVKLVDVGSAPIERFTPRGLVAGGREHPLDALVMATGFDALTGTVMRLDLKGRDGITIQQKWRDGPLNYLGLTTAGFPNLFNVAGVGSTAAFTNLIVAIEHHIDWISDCVTWMNANGKTSIEATEQSEAAWMDHMQAVAEHTVFLSCNSWYLGANIPGKPRKFMALTEGFPTYAKRCGEIAAAGYTGFTIR